jgi:asparagine synthase (glutamine-hydrolysing)
VCGIAGFVGADPGADNEGALHRMVGTLVHRGPDDLGTWLDREAGVAIGFRRLAILDLSPSGHQPMLSSDGRFVIAFNGEIYNHRELRAELEMVGHRFRGRSDTEVIVEGCSVWGPDGMVRRLSGMFAIALWDRQERELVLARDPVGKKPMYYARTGGLLLFGSELKALRAHPDFRAEVDRDALALYLRYRYVPAPYAIYRNTRKLLPGQYALVRAGAEPELRRFWDPLEKATGAMRAQPEVGEEQAVEELDSLLRDAVARRMVADVPLGAFLSGGIDSSTVVALMQAQSPRPVRTFTIGFHEDGYNEAEAAKAVARHLGTDHTELYVTSEEARAVIPLLPNIYDEPFADSSQIPTYLVSRLARQQVTVSLSGDGGDELFGGYTRYALAERIWCRMGLLPGPARGLAARLLRSVPVEGWDRIYAVAEATVLPRGWRQSLPGDKIYKLSRVLGEGDRDALYTRLISLWKEPCRVVVGAREPALPYADGLLRQGMPNFTERMMFRDLVAYLPEDILVKVDRASMAVSLEARAPLLDTRVVQWAWRLPLAMKVRNGQGKWLLRRLLYRYVPAELVDRPKTGFGVPIGAWLRGPLRAWAEELLGEARLRREGFFRPGPIREAWRAHLTGRSNDEYRLWAVLMFQAWAERWMP